LSKPNILVLPSLFPSAPDDLKGVFVLDYLKSVAQHCNITVLHFTMFGKEGEKKELVDGFEVFRYSFARPGTLGKKLKLFFYPFYYYMMKRKIARHMPGKNLVHTHGAFLQGYAAARVCKSHAIPLIITEHTGPFSKLTTNFLIKKFVKYAIEKANVLLTVSHDLKTQVLESGIKPKRIEVTYNPVDTNLFLSGNDNSKSLRKNIVFAGRLEDYKGGLRTLKAFNKIRLLFPDWKLTLIGDGPEMTDIRQMLEQESGLSESVKCLGQIDKRQMAEEFKKGSFLFFPSAHETFGLVIAEAMAAGLPVVVSNITAPKEFVDSECGLLVDPYETDALLGAMKKMIETVDQYDSTVIRNKIESRFGFEKFGANMMDIYNSQL